MSPQGVPPTNADVLWLEAAKELAPSKQLEKVNSRISFIFSNVTFVGTIVAGVGVFTDVGPVMRQHESALRWILMALGLAVLFAVLANLPSLKSSINPSNILAVKSYFNRLILVRGWLARFALISFSTAVVLALVLVYRVSDETRRPSVGIQWSKEEATLTALGTVKATGLPEGTRVETTLIARDYSGAESILVRDLSQVDNLGNLEISVKASKLQEGSYAQFRLDSLMTHNEKRLFPKLTAAVGVPN